MTQPAPADKTLTQADVDRIVADRITRERQKFADYDDLKAQAAELAKLKQEQETANEKAVREASETAAKAARDKVLPELVAAEFRAVAAGRIDRERLATLTDDIDLTRYLRDDGTVDIDKVTKKVEAWAPPTSPEPVKPKGPKPDRSQGASGDAVTGMDAGRQMFQDRRKPRPANT